MLRKVILINYDFEPDDELNKLIKGRGYQYLLDIHAKMVERIIKLVQNNIDEFEEYYKKNKYGSDGYLSIDEVDISKL